MIRIDEIYNNTVWPWIRQHRPGTRLFLCDPFGHTDPEHLMNYGTDEGIETNYVFMHDQEPVQLEAHKLLFNDVIGRNWDLPPGPRPSVVVSEQGENVQQLESIYGWKSHYYFFHGWACLDWYRGYDKTFLFPGPSERSVAPTQSFICPNRIIGGLRDHRVLWLYLLIKQGLGNNYVSAPLICPAEHVHICDVAKRYNNIFPDIEQVLSQADLPMMLPNEHTQEMSSCWLSNFDACMDSLIYVATETVFFGRRLHITEKTFKPIATGMPFVLVAPAGSLEYMRSYGFKTFADIWDETYDHETDDITRLIKTATLVSDIQNCSHQERQQIWRHCLPVVEHNWNHFYRGGFESVLWTELMAMLDGI